MSSASASRAVQADTASQGGVEIGKNPHRSARRDFWRRFAKNRLALASLVYLVFIHFVSFLAPVIAPHSPEGIDLTSILVRFSSEHWVGTDESGRDVLSRLLYGGRVSLVVGLVSVIVATIVGTLLGALSGYAGGWLDSVIMRVTDAFLAIPTFFLLLTILTLFGTTLTNIVLVIGLTSWMNISRIVRGDVLRLRNEEYVTAARVLGANDSRIVGRHILPQAMPSIIVSATLGIAFAIITESSLSFLGLGIQPPLPSWGNMLTASQQYVWTAPRLAVYPGVLIVLTVLAYTLLGNALRDTLDPKLRGR
jgi:peptide/nickel transport system permease protein